MHKKRSSRLSICAGAANTATEEKTFSHTQSGEKNFRTRLFQMLNLKRIAHILHNLSEIAVLSVTYEMHHHCLYVYNGFH